MPRENVSVSMLVISLLLMGAPSCIPGVSAALHTANPPFQLLAQPVVERNMMRSPLAQRRRTDYLEAWCVLTNTSNHIQGFHTSAMAEWLDWKTSDPRIFIPPLLFVSVAVGTTKLRPNEQYIYSVPLSMRRVHAGQIVKFRVGFRLIKWTPGQRLWQEGRLLPVREQTVWSRVISVKVRQEWTAPSAVTAAEGGWASQ